MSLLNVNKIAPQSGTAFTLGDSGDTFTVPSGATLTVAGTFTQTGTQTFDGGVDIDNFNINGTTIALSSGDMTLDVAGDIVLDADGGDVFVKDAGTTFGSLTNTSGNLIIKSGTTTAATFSGANVTLAGTVASGAITSSGIVKTDDATDATSTTDGSLQTDGGLSVAKDTIIGNDLKLLSDSAVLVFGAGSDATLTHTNDVGLTLNSTNKLMFNDATQYIQGASGTVLDIAATDEIELTATLLDVNANLDVSGTSLLPTLGVITAKDLGVGIHIRTSDSSADVDNTADELVIESSGDAGLSILTGTSNSGHIMFGDSGDNNIGKIQYNHDNNGMFFFTNATQNLKIGSDGKVGVVEPNPDSFLCITQGSDDSAIMSFKSSDVAHGVTGEAETDTYGAIRKHAAANGGMNFQSFTEDEVATSFTAIFTNAHTGNARTARAAFEVDGLKKDGTSVTSLGDDDNIFTVRQGNSTRFIVKGDGDIYYDGADQGAFDTYEDAQLVRTLDLSRNKNLAGVIDSKFDDYIKYNHETLANAGLVGREKDGTPNHFISVTGMQRLHNGAIWQQYEKHNQLLEAVYELATISIGEEKANAILKKHEVKRLN